MSRETGKSAPVPSSRLSRMMHLGGLASRIAGNVAVETGRHLLKGQKPELNDLLLNTTNLSHVADKLASMRGAAMKMGQLISMDAGTVLPRELAEILDRLRSDAVTMPPSQLIASLNRNWGEGWDQRFKRFSFQPMAAASIGQVHKAVDKKGHELAIKVQYPGVRQSIDSDLDNVYGLLKFSGILPKELDLEPVLQEARYQLHQEANYQQEGQNLQDYQQYLNSLSQFEHCVVPGFYPELSTEEILCMDFIHGQPLELAVMNDRALANRVMTQLFELFFAELLTFHCVQTDPNLANYQLEEGTQKLVLLDLGALCRYPPEFVATYKAAIVAAQNEDKDKLLSALEQLGFFEQAQTEQNLEIILSILMMAAEPLRHDGPYDFARSDLAQRIRDKGMGISRDPSAWHTPPPEVIFLHRKMGGLYLMATKLRACVDIRAVFEPYCADVELNSEKNLLPSIFYPL
ncbi:ABC1 kinase family protein [Oceanospirillum sediminis]|uniref:AarF/ABC1/UbiB kinase family protein n=1 Tax=Oceanospirillum sediminis TaxID=2760088 RepID=A0A839IKN2_9GAMM|nr:AarF/ABC1/UbiB kinase family protein [Oceanospirillum sediminis]MBB1485755.1 AarF/ABC1/UbiB kinase family protein [Oceanospirillum sediminis]